MKAKKDRPGWAALVTAFLGVLLVVAASCLLLGCASSQPREVLYSPFVIPTAPPELEGISWEELWSELTVFTLSREAVVADGSVLIQALTHDFLIVLHELRIAFTQRDASNASRVVALEGQAEAEAELERLRSQ